MYNDFPRICGATLTAVFTLTSHVVMWRSAIDIRGRYAAGALAILLGGTLAGRLRKNERSADFWVCLATAGAVTNAAYLIREARGDVP